MEILNYQYDCCDALEFASNLPDETIQLIVTSPPYNIGKEYETRVSIEEYIAQIRPIIEQCTRALRQGGSICWQTGNFVDRGEVYPLDIFYYPIFKELGLHLRNRIIWHFGHGLHCKTVSAGDMRPSFGLQKGTTMSLIWIPFAFRRNIRGRSIIRVRKRPDSSNRKGKNPEDVWEMTLDRLYDDWESLLWDIPNVKSNHVEKVDHPCQFPVELVERCVLALSNEGDCVYDPFAGVGSTLIAALKNNRMAMGSEREQQYVDIGRERIKLLEKDSLKTRPIYQAIYQPKATDKIVQMPEEWKEG